MPFLRSIHLKQKESGTGFPFNIPVFKNFKEITFDSPVVFFVGENGSGKSTLIESIAYGMNTVAVGSESLETDNSLVHIRSFSSHLRFVKNKGPKRGFFFRAEDFFGFIKKVKSELNEFKQLEEEYEQRLSGYGKLLATGMAKGQQSALASRYGNDPDALSHGESFLNLFESRLVPNGFYLLDEPEAPLSPQRQLSLLSFMKQMTEKSCQFIIATHSPILMAYPGAQIWSFDGPELKTIAYDDVEHVSLTKAFLKGSGKLFPETLKK